MSMFMVTKFFHGFHKIRKCKNLILNSYFNKSLLTNSSLLNYVSYVFSDPTCLVPFVLSCLTCLVPYVLLLLACLVPYVLLCLLCLVLSCSCALRASCPTLSCLTCFSVSRASCPTCSRPTRASCFTCFAPYMLFALRPLCLTCLVQNVHSYLNCLTCCCASRALCLAYSRAARTSNSMCSCASYVLTSGISSLTGSYASHVL